MSVRYRTLVGIWGLLWAAAHGLLLVGVSLPLGFAAAYTLTILLPAWLLMDGMGGREPAGPATWLERGVLGLGAAYALATLTTLLLGYLPGGLQPWQLLLAFDLLLVLLFIAGRWLRRSTPDATPTLDGRVTWRWWLGLGLVVAVAAFLRMADVGYAEFQDDEVTVVTHAAEMIQGREDALFVHDKGPAEILLTALHYAPVQRLNEATARLPFGVAGVIGLMGVMLLGTRLFGPLAGWLAAILLALDGYFIGFGRIVQYQSVVFLMVVLTVLLLYRMVQAGRLQSHGLVLVALCLATGILAHFEALFAVVPGLYLLSVLWRREGFRPREARTLLLAVGLGLGLLALFFVPFALHPRFQRTYEEILFNRVGTGFPYNNLYDFFFRTTIYSSTYYVALLMAAAAGSLLAALWRYRQGWVRWAGAGLVLLGLGLTLWSSTWLTVVGQDHTWLPFVAFSLACLAPGQEDEERMLWLWLGVTLVVSLFFVQKPRTHVYNFFFPWALVAGMGLARFWQWSARRLGEPTAQTVGVGLAGALILLFGNYEYWYFAHTRVEVLRTWAENRPRGYWVSYHEPSQNAIFGFPFKNGWKVVGALYAQGVLDGPFARNGKRGVAGWYTRGGNDCERDHVYYIYTPENEPTNRGLVTPKPRPSAGEGYHLLGTVMVNGEPRLEIYRRGQPPASPPKTYDVADFEAYFDQNLSSPLFEQSGPVANPAIQHPLALRLGDAILLRGYTLSQERLAPGERLDLTLYWQATGPIQQPYTVFTQLIDLETLHKAGQRDGVPGCERFPTDRWQPGDIMVDRYAIAVAADAPPGTYSLLVGMYDRNEERLPVFDEAGAHLGDAIVLTQLSVQSSAD